MCFCSVSGALPENLSTALPPNQVSSTAASSLLYAIDAAAYKDTLQDVRDCKEALLEMRQLLQQVYFFNIKSKSNQTIL